MKDKIIIILLAVLLGLCGFGIFKSIQASKIRKQYDIAMQNNKAYESQLDVIQEENRIFQFTVEQLEALNDKSIKELDSMRKELGIKDKKIQQMSKVKEKIYIVDSIVVHDTIFDKPDFVLDTCLGDEWYQNCLHMAYPNEISSQIDINTDLNCFIHTSRETINPPCKTWIGRLFQRKHTVINVTVKENNPYSNIQETKFIKIIDK